MKVILSKDVESLGDEGDVKIVADGYGRNYLLPRGLAMPFTKHAENLIEQRRAKIEARKEEKRKAALGLKDKLVGLEVVLSMPAGDNGKLFGAVTNQVVADELLAKGISVEKRQISIHGNGIKVVGTYEVKIKIMDKEYAHIKVTVNPSGNA